MLPDPSAEQGPIATPPSAAHAAPRRPRRPWRVRGCRDVAVVFFGGALVAAGAVWALTIGSQYLGWLGPACMSAASVGFVAAVVAVWRHERRHDIEPDLLSSLPPENTRDCGGVLLTPIVSDGVPGGTARLSVFYQNRFARPACLRLSFEPWRDLFAKSAAPLPAARFELDVGPAEVGAAWADLRLPSGLQPGSHAWAFAGTSTRGASGAEVRIRDAELLFDPRRETLKFLFAVLAQGRVVPPRPTRVLLDVKAREPLTLIVGPTEERITIWRPGDDAGPALQRLLRACAVTLTRIPVDAPAALRAPPASPAERASLALGAILARLHGDPVDRVRTTSSWRSAVVLGRDWNVSTPEQARDLLHALLAARDPAWDLSRGVAAARWCATCGLIEEDEARRWILDAGRQAAARMESWEAWGDRLEASWRAWSTPDRQETTAIEWVRKDPASPWSTTPWGDLPR